MKATCRKNAKKLAMPFLMLLSAGACSSESSSEAKNSVSPEDAYGGYWLTYKAANKSLRVFAQFRESDLKSTPVAVEESSKLQFENKTMSLKEGDSEYTNMSGANYQVTLQEFSQIPESFTYQWKNTKSETVKVKLPMAQPINKIVILPEDGKLTPGTPLQATFEGADNRKEETIKCVLRSDTPEKISTIEVKLSKVESCIFGAAQLQVLPKGTAKLYVIRTWTSQNVNGHPKKGGFLESDFESEPVTVEIVP
jgi:hypothetical protein